MSELRNIIERSDGPRVQMELVESIPTPMVAKIISLVADSAMHPGDLLVKRRALVSAIAELLDADLWLWTTSSPRPDTGEVAATSIISGGWRNEDELAKLIELHDTPVGLRMGRLIASSDGHITMARHHMASDEDFFQTRWYRESSFDDCIISIYPTVAPALSCVGLHRAKGKPRFNALEMTVMHLVLSQVDWMHHGLENPELANTTLALTARQRHVLVQLICGRTTREISDVLGISQYTVNDHIKAVLNMFEVKSRTELLARYLNGRIFSGIHGDEPMP